MGLFSLTGQQQQQPSAPPPANPYTDLTKLQDPYGGKAAYFLDKSPLADADDELKKLQEDIYKNKIPGREDLFKDFTPLEKMRRGIPNISEEEYFVPSDIGIQYEPSEEENRRALQDKLVSKFRQQFDQKIYSQQQPSTHMLFSVHGAQQQRSFRQSQQPLLYTQQKTFGTDSSFEISRQGSMNNNEQSLTQALPKVFKPQIQQQQQPIYQQQQQERQVNPDIFQIEISIPLSQGGNRLELINIHRSRDVADLYRKIRKMLCDEGRFNQDVRDVKLLYKNAIMQEKLSLKDAGVDKDTKISVIFEMAEHNGATRPAPEQKTVIEEPVKQVTPPPAAHVPGRPKQGYLTCPSFEEITRMTDAQLIGVQNFTISNQYGTICFDGATDITDVDLADVVTIEHMGVEVYDANRHKPYPKVGEKLNKPAIITLNGIVIPQKKTVEKFIQILQKQAEDQDGQHIQYDLANQTWIFKVSHFTKYKLNMLDEDEEEVEEGMEMQEEETSHPIQPETTSYASKWPQATGMAPVYQSLLSTQQQQVTQRRRPNYIADDQNMSEQDEEEVVLTPSKRLSAPPLQARASREDVLMLRRDEIDKKIKQRLKAMEGTSRLFGEKPSVQESLKYLDKMQVQVNKAPNGNVEGFKNQPLKVNRFRPQFTSQGKLLILKSNNKLEIKEVPIVQGSKNEEQLTTYKSMTQVLLEHTGIEEFSNDHLSNAMDQMALDEEQVSRIELQARLQPRREASAKYEDQNIQEILTNINLPMVSFKEDPRDLFKFFESMAKFLINAKKGKSQAASDKLQQEFYIICTMNALFGNPNINLVQLHNDFHGGIKNYDKMRQRFTQESEFTDGYNHLISKKRKNAIIEVLRFICMQEYKPPVGGASPYTHSLRHLLNGDVKSAVKILNEAGKQKMAIMVINSVQNNMQKEALKLMCTTQYKVNNADANQLIDFITGEYFKQQGREVGVQWEQALLYYLMFSGSPTESLETIVQNFYKEVYAQFQLVSEPLLWTLTKFYALSYQDPDILHKQLMTFSNLTVYPKGHHHDQDYRLPFLLTLSFQGLLQHVKRHRDDYKQYRSVNVTHERLYHFASLYASQLLRANDWQQALLVAQYIPITYNSQRKQMTLIILQTRAHYLINEIAVPEQVKQEMQGFILKKLMIPPAYVWMARAMSCQAFRQQEAAMGDWSKVGNQALAHSLFMRHIAPLYFAGNKNVVARLTEAKSLLSDMLAKFKQDGHFVQDYSSQGQLIKDFLEAIKDYNPAKAPGQWLDKDKALQIATIAKELKDVNSEPPYLGLLVIKRQIWELLLTWSKELKLKGELNSFDELASLYLESPQLSRHFDEVCIKLHTEAYCNGQSGNPQGPSSMFYSHVN